MRVLALPVLVLGVLVLAGCGGGGSTPPATVTVTVPASGPSPTAATSTRPAVVKQAEIPDVVGQNGAVAEDTLRQAGFTNVQDASRDSDARVVLQPANWTVTKVEPEAGTTVEVNRLIVVTMTKQQ